MPFVPSLHDSPRDAVRLGAIGIHLPDRRDSNLELATSLGVDHDFLEHKVGVLYRSVRDVGETTSDIAVRAFASLQANVDLPTERIEALIVVTQHPDFKVPHTAALVHNRLGLGGHCMTFDISQGCAGFTHGVAIVTGVMDAIGLDHAVLITSDPYSDKVLPTDRDTALLFGDAATASYFSRRGPGYRLVDANFGTVPDSHRCLLFRDRLEMDGSTVFKHAVRQALPGLKALLARNGLGVGDIDLFLLHQGSKYLVEYVAGKLGIPADKAPYEAVDYGNTVSSSIPLMLQRHVADGRLDRIALSGFGVGFTWGNNLLCRVRPET